MTTIWADGGHRHMMVRGKYKPTAYGSFSTNGKIHEYVFGPGTSQTAEFKTLIAALEYCRKHHIQFPTVFMDSRSVVDAMNGTGTARARTIVPLYNRAAYLRDSVGAVVEWVPREAIMDRLGH
jgi:ribonuclease HI